MATIVREWRIAELQQRRACTACDAPGARPARPEIARGFDPKALDDYLPWAPLCADCALRQMHARRAFARAALAVALLPAALAALVAAVVPSQQPWPMALAAVTASSLAWTLIKRLALRYPVPALVTGGKGATLRVHLDVPEARVSSRDAVACPPDPSGALLPLGLAVAVGLASGVAIWGASNPLVLFDNAADASCAFTVDDGGYMLAPHERAGMRVHHGAHRFVLRTADGPQLVPLDVPWDGDLVVPVSAPGEQCRGP